MANTTASAVALQHDIAGGTAEGRNLAELGGKYLTFFLGDEEYGIEILRVQEIIGMMPITPVPRTPQYICGVINLRGKVIPILDLRTKFEMATVGHTDETCIIVVDANGFQMGVVVDKVSEVLDIAASEIEDPPQFGSAVDADYILGIGKTGGRIELLLDIVKVLADQEITEMHLLSLEPAGDDDDEDE